MVLSGGGILRTFEAPQQFSVSAEDSTRFATHFATASTVTCHCGPRIRRCFKVDSSATIAAGSSSTSTPRVTSVGVGTAMVIATISGGIPDTVTYQVQQAKLAINFSTLTLGVAQFTPATGVYGVSTPDSRNVAVPVKLTHGTVDSLSSTSLSVAANNSFTYFGVTGLTKGRDTVIASATGYASDTVLPVVITTTVIRMGDKMASRAPRPQRVRWASRCSSRIASEPTTSRRIP